MSGLPTPSSSWLLPEHPAYIGSSDVPWFNTRPTISFVPAGRYRERIQGRNTKTEDDDRETRKSYTSPGSAFSQRRNERHRRRRRKRQDQKGRRRGESLVRRFVGQFIGRR